MNRSRAELAIVVPMTRTFRATAARAGKSLSSWLAEAATGKLRAEALATFLDDWEAEHGTITAEELAVAEHELGLASGSSAS